MAGKKELLELAADILKRLPDDGYIDLYDESALKAVKANEKGSHYVVIGDIPDSDLDVEIWLECNTGWAPPPNFWYGIGGSLYRSITTVAEFGKTKYRDHKKFMVYEQEEKVPATKGGFGHPVLEGKKPSKRHSEYYYGIYIERFPNLNSPPLPKAANFIREVTIGYAEEFGRQLSAIEGMEGNKKYAKHRITERDSKIAKAAKLKAKYICGVCGFKFQKMPIPFEQQIVYNHLINH